MRAKVSPRIGGLNVHVEPRLNSRVKDSIEPGMVVVVLDRGAHMTHISYTRRYMHSPPESNEGFVVTAKLDFLPDMPAPELAPETDVDWWVEATFQWLGVACGIIAAVVSGIALYWLLG